MPQKTDEWYLAYAGAVSKRSDCTRRRVGAVVVWAGSPVAMDWNRGEEKVLSCSKGDCPRGRKDYIEVPMDSPYNDCIAIHAEIRTLELFLAVLRKRRIEAEGEGWAKGATMYVTHEPCHECAPVLAASGIAVVFRA